MAEDSTIYTYDVYVSVLENQLAQLQAEAAMARYALEQIRGYWNGCPESAVDAIEEAQSIADEVLDGMVDSKRYLDRMKALEEENRRLREACKLACEYYEMLENATGIEHGVLRELRQAIAEQHIGGD